MEEQVFLSILLNRQFYHAIFKNNWLRVISKKKTLNFLVKSGPRKLFTGAFLFSNKLYGIFREFKKNESKP